MKALVIHCIKLLRKFESFGKSSVTAGSLNADCNSETTTY
jgi:hypothetical protein